MARERIIRGARSWKKTAFFHRYNTHRDRGISEGASRAQIGRQRREPRARGEVENEEEAAAAAAAALGSAVVVVRPSSIALWIFLPCHSIALFVFSIGCIAKAPSHRPKEIKEKLVRARRRRAKKEGGPPPIDQKSIAG